MSFIPKPRPFQIWEGRIHSTYKTSTHTNSQPSNPKSSYLLLTQYPFRSNMIESTPHIQHLHIQTLNLQVKNHVIYFQPKTLSDPRGSNPFHIHNISTYKSTIMSFTSSERWAVSNNTWAMSSTIWAINPNLIKTHGFRVYNQKFDKLIVYF